MTTDKPEKKSVAPRKAPFPEGHYGYEEGDRGSRRPEYWVDREKIAKRFTVEDTE